MGECQPYFATEDQVVQVISPYRDKLSIAAVNGPQQIVISGHVDSMNEALKDFKKEQISFQQLNVSHAFSFTFNENRHLMILNKLLR